MSSKLEITGLNYIWPISSRTMYDLKKANEDALALFDFLVSKVPNRVYDVIDQLIRYTKEYNNLGEDEIRELDKNGIFLPSDYAVHRFRKENNL